MEAGTSITISETGELVDLASAPPDRLAELYDQLGLLNSQVRVARNAISEEVHRRMDEQARWTVNAGPWKLSGASPSRVTYRPEDLRRELILLVADGVITEQAALAAVEKKVTYTVRPGGVNNLRKLGGRVAAAIDTCTEPASGPRRLTVTRGA